MIRCLLPGVLCGLLALTFVGCASLDDDHAPAGQAEIVVTNVIESQIQRKAEDVFFRHGFEYKGATEGRMEFERAGGTLDIILYGNWQKKDMTTNVTLFIIPKGPTTYALRTRAMAVRESFGADSDDKHFDVQGVKYNTILEKIAKELREENPL
jgi:hypothetical protein